MFACSRVMLCVVLAGVILGCAGGDGAQKTATLAGEVKRINGSPVGNVSVIFHPEKGQPVVTKTDAAGKFSTSAPLGPCKVAVVAEAAATADSSPGAAQAMINNQNQIKPQYMNPESSGLSVDVKASQTEKLVFVVE